jgi:hypothetical protein
MNKKYKYFKVSDIFHSKRGKRWIKENQTPGDIAYVSSTALNNGIDNLVTPPDFMKIYNNKLTFSNSGSVGRLFYHDYDFVASDHVTVIWIKNRELNKYIALFLKPIFEHIRYKYNFGREIKDPRLKAETIYLPINDSGKPDWDYMEKYIISLEEKVKFYSIDTQNKRKNEKLDLSNWKEFTLCGKNGLFEYQHGSRLVVPQRIVGDIPLITAGKKNQGYAQSISNYEEEECFEAGITIDMFANCFYQNNIFAADDNIYIFNKPQKINKYIVLFLVTIINQQLFRYGYGRQFRKEDTEKNKYLLPVTSEGQPDWQFMENYIKSLPYADNI